MADAGQGQLPAGNAMKELVRTNDPVRISWLTSMLAEGGVVAIVLDTHTSILEGQIGAIPRRVMVIDEDFQAARRILANAEREITTASSLDALLRARITRSSNRWRAIGLPLIRCYWRQPRPVPVSSTSEREWVRHCYAHRFPEAKVTGLELQTPLAELARANVVRNELTTQVEILNGDLLAPPEALSAVGFDQVMANPPYLPAGRADPH